MNSGHYRWAWIERALTNGLERTRNNYGHPMIINSGYRNPLRNSEIRDPEGRPASRTSNHQYGVAVDVRTPTVEDREALEMAASGTGTTEVLRYPRHLHLAW